MTLADSKTSRSLEELFDLVTKNGELLQTLVGANGSKTPPPQKKTNRIRRPIIGSRGDSVIINGFPRHKKRKKVCIKNKPKELKKW